MCVDLKSCKIELGDIKSNNDTTKLDFFKKNSLFHMYYFTYYLTYFTYITVFNHIVIITSC